MACEYLIFGNGQVGSALKHISGEQAKVITRMELDFSTATEEQFLALIRAYKPGAIINAAAYTAVDKAEGEGRALAFQVNADAVDALAKAAFLEHIPLVHYSTDYVFDGSSQHYWRETDATHPLNVYGASKLSGEQLVQASGAPYLIFRISWVYAEEGTNFLNTMLRLGAERESLNIVSDQIGAPSYAADIATATLAALKAAMQMDEFPSGIYHMTPGGETSWYGFAEEIFRQARHLGVPLTIQNIKPITTAEYPTPAARPLNSRMNNEKLFATFNIALPDWDRGLAYCLKHKFSSTAVAGG